MRAEVEEEKVLVSALTKPLHLTQLEEQAIQAELLNHTRIVPNIRSILPDILKYSKYGNNILLKKLKILVINKTYQHFRYLIRFHFIHIVKVLKKLLLIRSHHLFYSFSG